jgi:hypothetical protein
MSNTRSKPVRPSKFWRRKRRVAPLPIEEVDDNQPSKNTMTPDPIAPPLTTLAEHRYDRSTDSGSMSDTDMYRPEPVAIDTLVVEVKTRSRKRIYSDGGVLERSIQTEPSVFTTNVRESPGL